MKLAILDLGTNTFHLLIAEVAADGSWHKLLKERITVKIGQGGIAKNTITAKAYSRGINALDKFHATIKKYKVKKIYAFGTAALRSAINGLQFIDDANKHFEFNIKLITGNQEAKLIYLGVKQAVPLGSQKSLIMDVGGGSVEFIIANESRIFWKQSFKLGAALLLDKFKPSDPMLKSDVKAINDYIALQLKPLLEAFKKHRPYQIIGSAGSFETLASMIRHQFPESGSHYGKTVHPISVYHFQNLFQKLVVSSKVQRYQMRGLIKMRVDMIVMASLLLRFILQKTKLQQIKLSTYSLKEGALLQILKAN